MPSPKTRASITLDHFKSRRRITAYLTGAIVGAISLTLKSDAIANFHLVRLPGHLQCAHRTYRSDRGLSQGPKATRQRPSSTDSFSITQISDHAEHPIKLHLFLWQYLLAGIPYHIHHASLRLNIAKKAPDN